MLHGCMHTRKQGKTFPLVTRNNKKKRKKEKFNESRKNEREK